MRKGEKRRERNAGKRRQSNTRQEKRTGKKRTGKMRNKGRMTRVRRPRVTVGRKPWPSLTKLKSKVVLNQEEKTSFNIIGKNMVN